MPPYRPKHRFLEETLLGDQVMGKDAGTQLRYRTPEFVAQSAIDTRPVHEGNDAVHAARTYSIRSATAAPRSAALGSPLAHAQRRSARRSTSACAHDDPSSHTSQREPSVYAWTPLMTAATLGSLAGDRRLCTRRASLPGVTGMAIQATTRLVDLERSRVTATTILSPHGEAHAEAQRAGGSVVSHQRHRQRPRPSDGPGLTGEMTMPADPATTLPTDEAPDGPVSVLMFRNTPEHRSKSMERFADELAAGLRGRPEVRVEETTVHASRLEGHRFLRKVDRYLLSFVRYPRHARRQSADVYHVIDHAFGHLIGSIRAERAIITCHDLMLLHAEHEDIGFRGSRLAVRRFGWSTSFLQQAALVACVSEATASDVTNLLGISPSKVRVIPLGIGSAFAPIDALSRSRARVGIDPTGQRALVLHVSTGGAYKNVSATLRVIDALRHQGMDPILLRVGEPLDERQVALAKELGVHDRIREFTDVSDRELATIYAAADVLLFPSRWEGFGWPPLEALACGTPSVVAAECRSVVDLVGAAAIVVPADDVLALSEAVRRIIVTPSLRRSLVESGRARVAALTWGRTVDAYVDAYEEIASRFT